MGTPSNHGAGASGSAWGGGVYCANGTLNCSNVTATLNLAGGGDPTIAESNGAGGSGGGAGMYLSSSVFLLVSSAISNNTAIGTIFPVTGTLGFSTGSGMGGGLVALGDSLGLVQLCSFSGNCATGGNSGYICPSGPGQGGAIFNGGRLTLLNSVFSGNLAVNPGAAPANAGQGGAIFSSNNLGVAGCTFYSNLAQGGNGAGYTESYPGGPGEGGAIWSSGQLQITNSTLTANSAVGGQGGAGAGPAGAGGIGSGGAIRIAGGNAVLVNVTVAANTAQSGGPYEVPPPPEGGGLSNTNGVFTLRNSISAYNTNGGDVWGAFTDAGYNLCSDSTGNFSGPGSLNNADPLLGALAYNGGSTPTMVLLVGSPARDIIPSGFAATDQRGVSRPQGPAADSGAFEADYVGSGPIIVNQPHGGRVLSGTNFTFMVGASGTPPLAYQWWKDGNPIARGTDSSYSITNVQAGDAGTYIVVVTNASGSATSDAATLVVDSSPRIVSQPVSVIVPPGANTNFTVVADGPSLAFQWWHNGSAVTKATASSLPIINAGPGSQGGYFVVITNDYGTVTSSVASLTFDSSALNIQRQPSDQTVEAGYSATFSVQVAGVAPFAYQWQRDGSPIDGATGSSFTLMPVHTNDNGSGFNVIVTNGYSSVTSTVAHLYVTAGAVPPLLIVGRSGNNLTITFNAQAGRTYRLLNTQDFSAWTSVATNTALTAGPIQFVESLDASSNNFYRVVTP